MGELNILNNNNYALPVKKIEVESVVLEKEVEEIIEKNPKEILGIDLLFIGRQVTTNTGKILDLLAVDSECDIVVIELKRDFAPREVIAQVIDYAAWINSIPEREIDDIAREYFQKNSTPYKSLHLAYESHFKSDVPKRFGEEVKMILFAHKFPIEVINAAEFLSERGTSIQAIEYEMFKENNKRFLYTNDIVSSSTEIYRETQTQIHPDKYHYREILKKIASKAKVNYESLLSELSYDPLWKFQVYQSRPGDWGAVYTDWKVDNSQICFEIGCHLEQNDTFHYLKLFPRKKSDFFLEKIASADIQEIIKNHNYVIEDENTNKPSIVWYFPDDFSLSDENIKVVIKAIDDHTKELIKKFFK